MERGEEEVEDNRRESGSGGGSRGKPTPPSCQVDIGDTPYRA